MEQINFDLLELLSRRARLVTRIQEVKTKEGVPTFVPEREQRMIERLLQRNNGPFPDESVRKLVKEVFAASGRLMEHHQEKELRISRPRRPDRSLVRVGDAVIGGEPMVLAGPCSIESAEQMDQVGRYLRSAGVKFLRGGAFKPRSSPYSFQGLGEEGLRLLQDTARRHGLVSITEVMDTRTVELVSRYADVLQVGARNMYNYDLLREVGRARRPVLSMST